MHDLHCPSPYVHAIIWAIREIAPAHSAVANKTFRLLLYEIIYSRAMNLNKTL